MNKIALITGGSRGLGLHLVKRFWLEGYSLGVVARNVVNIEKTLNELPKREEQSVILLPCDLGDANQVITLIERIKLTIPYIDVLINNAAIQGPIGRFFDNDILEWNRTLRVNLITPVTLCHGLISMIKKNNGSSIINLSGGGATGPRANFSAYATAKTALVRFSETLAEELKTDKIRVNCIAPGAMKTDMLKEVLIKKNSAGEQEVSIAKKVFAEKEEVSMDRVADLAIFLASDISKGITGRIISAIWDNWEQLPKYLLEFCKSDIYTLRRITSRDRGYEWGDK
jgi:NAD(P)-dependent dehydrogenase (short-subunit alcohol dehydrogenase family)